MNKKITTSALEKLGLKAEPRVHEDEFYFDVHTINKGDSTLDVVTSYKTNDLFIDQYIDFNGETLKGKHIGSFQLEALIKMM